MNFIEPHAHLVSRTTDDYAALAQAGCIAISEPAFWAGYDRCSVDGFRDYYTQLVSNEPSRAAKYGIDHYCWLCINPKEAEDVGFAREVMSLIPEFIDNPHVLGIGEIGLNRNTKNEVQIYEEQLDLAIQLNQPILIHTPHLEDKLKGTKIIIDGLKNRPDIDPRRVIIDHCEEHTIKLVKDAGYWAGITLYPISKCTPDRLIDMLELYGLDQVWMNSATDWGHSDPLSVPKTLLQMKRRGFLASECRKLVLENPHQFLSNSPHFLTSID